MCGAGAAGGYMSVVTLFRWKTHLLANVLLASVTGILSLIVFWRLFGYMPVTAHRHWWLFAPFYLTYAIGPLFFFSVKARLFADTRLRWSDFKHFIAPTVQMVGFGVLFFKPESVKQHLMTQHGFWLYGALHDLVFIVGTSAYLYFAYRFVKVAWAHLRQHPKPYYALIVGWQHRLIKGFILFFSLHALLRISQYWAWRLSGRNLEAHLVFSSALELTLAGLLLWLTLNAWFARQRSI